MKNNWKSEFDKIFVPIQQNGEDRWLRNGINKINIYEFIEKLLTQQKEEDAQIAEGKKINMDRRDHIYKYKIDINQRWYDKGQNDTCDNIAKAIRGKYEK